MADRKVDKMNEKRKEEISKFLSLILRHKPETIKLTLYDNGWASVEGLLVKSDRQRYSFSREE